MALTSVDRTLLQRCLARQPGAWILSFCASGESLTFQLPELLPHPFERLPAG